MQSGADSIKVAVRFRGQEHLSPEDNANWSFNSENQITTTSTEGKQDTFTFDSVLTEVSQEEMYTNAAKETIQ